MKHRIITLIPLLAITLMCFAAALGGTADDPLLSLSYMQGTWLPKFISSASATVSETFTSLENSFVERIEKINSPLDDKVSLYANKALSSLRKSGRLPYMTYTLTPLSLIESSDLICNTGCEFMIKSGRARITSGGLINLTNATELTSGALAQNTLFLAFSDTTLDIAENAVIMLNGAYRINAYKPEYLSYAERLKELGLVQGAATGFELERYNTRAESITMLIRLLGEENKALNMKKQHPFTDVPSWAQAYIGYAHYAGYTKGVSATRFDSQGTTSANHYMTFILRALGYDDANGDFKWDDAVAASVRYGVLTDAEATRILQNPFYRDQVMLVSYRALGAKLKQSSETLAQKLGVKP